MSKQSVKPVLLSDAQLQAIRNIQEQQRKQSGLGVAPSIHEIARGLVDTCFSRRYQFSSMRPDLYFLIIYCHHSYHKAHAITCLQQFRISCSY
ncbi:hypothetical protein N5F20_00475 [Citrobacter freundii]|uniref:hypothetical protein n=1 Tax=Citrobacter freundii TaxID=546 RepID=UPI00244B1202|nr:hypothetical protein [Citrobacter freundii]MDH1408973.1 hypothetical protein [Citrobacter freundii]